ncbi:MAG: ATP-binding protein, partial [Sphingomonadales bacterium]
MRYDQVIGQGPLQLQLTELVRQNRLSHALLLLSKEGSGALPLAIAFAQYLVCETVTASSADAPCGTCPACKKATQLIHPDIHFSYPTVTKKAGEKPIATDFINEWRSFVQLHPYGNLFDWIELIKSKENSQGKITSEECNDIIRKLSLKSFESPWKILILWLPELMGNEGNKLLKLIEEPPPDTLLMFVSENEAQLLSTIVSRCQLIKVPALETAAIEKALIERNNTPASLAAQLAPLCEGNYREALQLVQHAEEDWQVLVREWLNAMLKTGPVAQTKWVEEISRLGREKQKQFVRYFIHLLEQALHLRIRGGEYPIGEKERDFAERLNKIAGIEQQEAMVNELDQAHYQIERNANAKILFHALTIRLYHIIQDKSVF